MNAKTTQPTNTTTTTPEAETKARTRSAAVRAGQAYDKIRDLEVECIQEIADAPDGIKRRYAAKIEKVIGGLDDEAREHLARLRGETK